MNYKLATKHGIIVGWFSINMFSICKQKLITFDSLDLNKELTLRQINGCFSISGGQGFLKCNCSGKCDRNCSCKKNGVYCNSKCHKSLNNKCLNKN